MAELAAKTTEEQLRDSRELLRITLSSIGDAVVATDAQGNITFLNDAAEAVTGWTKQEATGQPLDTIFRIINEVTREPAENPVHRALGERAIVGLANHTILVTKNGTERPIDDNAAPIIDDKGRVAGCILVFRDVTESRRLERTNAERLAAARLLAAIVDSSQDAIIGKTLDGIITSWNGAAERLLGYTAAEAIGHHISLIIPAERRPEEDTILARLRAGERVEHFATVRVRKNGQPIDVSLCISPIRDETGRVIGASKIMRDITAQKESERRIHDLMEQMREADHRKDEFLAMLGHELRNPLAAVRTGIATASLDESRRARALDIARRQTDQLTRLVDDLLDVARITQGRIALHTEPVDLALVIDNAIESTRALVKARGLRLSTSPTPRPVMVRADCGRLEQAFVNLLSNAAKYTDPGGRIDISIERRDGDAVVHVHDTGIGIAPEMLPRIWDLFMQAERGIDRAQGGLGVGLTLARRIVELHGGHLEAHSAGIGKGTEFVITLQTVSATEAASEPAPQPPEPLPHRQIRILVVEDNADAAESLAMFLDLFGHDVRVVYNGTAALEAARSNVPDVMLVDVGLPGIDGYEVARRVREDADLRPIILVALTGYGRDEDKRRALGAGFDHHLIKPVNPDALHQLIAHLGKSNASELPR